MVKSVNKNNLQTGPWASVALSVLQLVHPPVFLFYPCRSEIKVLCQKLNVGYKTSNLSERMWWHLYNSGIDPRYLTWLVEKL